MKVKKSRPVGKKSTFLLCRAFLAAFGLMVFGSGNVAVTYADPPVQTGDGLIKNEMEAGKQSLLDAALNGDMKTVQAALDQGIEVNEADPDGRTALMFASYNGHTGIVRLLLDRGARVDGQDSLGRTALMFAASGPYRETVQLLLENSADPNIVDTQESWTALMFAAAEGQVEVVQALLNHGADKTLKDADGETALDFARNNKHADVVLLLE